MTQEEKELLLQDLYARLPYGVKFKANNEECIREIHYIKDENVYIREYRNLPYWIDTIKPYLRPMKSMTEKEKEELEHLSEEYFGKALDKQIQESLSSSNRNESRILEYIASSVIVDWLNKKMFDYRGLIPMGLALLAKEGMYDKMEE